jgi:hypothetical protein
MKRAALAGVAALVLAGCSPEIPTRPEVKIDFPDFPQNVADMDLGQSITIDVETANDDGAGVTWSCAGDACAPLKATPTSVTFKAVGITGTAVLKAVSKKLPDVTRQIRINVKLNESPDMVCK